MTRGFTLAALLSALIATPGVSVAQDGIIAIPSFTIPATPAPTDVPDPSADPDLAGDPLLDAAPAPVDPLDPGAGRLARHGAVSSVETVEEIAARKPIAPLLSLRAGANPGTTLRMQGENPEAEFSIFLPREAVPGALQLAHSSGVDVMPERSVIDVFVNGTEVGRVAAGRFEEDGPDLIEVPEGIWRGGRNEVVLRMRQAHRLFCGPEAAFDLWTDIDMTGSGAVLDSRPFSPGAMDFLAGVAHDAGLGRAIAIKDLSDRAKLAEPVLTELAQRLTGYLRGRILTYRTADLYEVAEGADTGLPQPLARITLLPGWGETEPRAEFRRGGDGAIVMALSVPERILSFGDAEAFLDTLLADLEGDDTMLDALAVQTGIDPRTQMPSGEAVTLASLGLETMRTSSHYFRRDQIFTLPRDWLVLTAQKAMLNLDYAYARNLPEKSIMLIRVNGETVRLLPLTGMGGEPIEQFPIKFNANLLREGPNLLQFEALIPGDPEDAACPDDSFPKLEIRGSSTLRVPESPRLRLAGMRLPVFALRGSGITVNGTGLEDLPTAERLTLKAMLGEAIPNASRLTVVTADRMGELPMGAYNISRSELHKALERKWTEPAAAVPDPADRIGELPDDLFGDAIVSPEPARAGAGDGRFFMLNLSLEDLRRRIYAVRDRLMPDPNAEAERWLGDQYGHALLAQLDRSDPRALWLVIEEEDDLIEVMASIASSRRSIGGPSGQIAVLDDAGYWRSWYDSRQLPELAEPLTLRNFRYVLGNYASWSPVAFTAILFGLAVISALIALRFVIVSRED
ncbi:cellulose biosynthesis cyclic di-GMP-binding regulatory protein BcsB [Palleronia sediminis]|nr:cellulose biosynthesis cyclic di-GMP-binding regulatory protein BcsB [Palleronia sediminis]